MAGDLLLAGDFLCLLFAAWLSSRFYTHALGLDKLPRGAGGYASRALLIAVVLAPLLLRDRRFGAVARRDQMALLVLSHLVRFVIFASVVLVLYVFSGVLAGAPRGWLLTWCCLGVLTTTLVRIIAALLVQHLKLNGTLADVVAVVGAGPVADRLLDVLLQHRLGQDGFRQDSGWNVELVGVFDDDAFAGESVARDGSRVPVGSLAQLIALGQKRRIDWIVLTLPATAGTQLLDTVQRLKALSAPIALCPENVGLPVPFEGVEARGEGRAMGLVADRRVGRPNQLLGAAQDCLPRWLITVARLPWVAVSHFAAHVADQAGARPSAHEPGRAR
jgi:FlaA1/EpsC-like NDP-sugar epimerase